MDQIEKRFWSKVLKTRIDECWLWNAAKNKLGYGLFWLNGAQGAHRVSYTLAFGPIPSGMDVRHKCDTPSCVNPNHLELGSQADNNQDMVLRRRHARKERHGFAKLTQEDVDAIKLWRTEFGPGTLSVVFGVSKRHIQSICANEYWRPDDVPARLSSGRGPKRGQENWSAKLTWQQVCQIRALASVGWTYRKIAAQFAVGDRQVSRIVRFESRKNA